MSLHDLALEFCGRWESGPGRDVFVRVVAPGGEFAVRDAPGGRYRVDWLPAAGGCQTAVLDHADVRRRVGAVPGYDHTALRLPAPRQVLEALLARFGFGLFGDCLMAPDRWLFCELTDVAASVAVLWDQLHLAGRVPTGDLVRRLRAANPGG